MVSWGPSPKLFSTVGEEKTFPLPILGSLARALQIRLTKKTKQINKRKTNRSLFTHALHRHTGVLGNK